MGPLEEPYRFRLDYGMPEVMDIPEKITANPLIDDIISGYSGNYGIPGFVDNGEYAKQTIPNLIEKGYTNGDMLGPIGAGIGMMANSHNIANSYTPNRYQAQAIGIPTSEYGLAEMSAMPLMKTKRAEDFGSGEIWKDALGGIASGAMAGAGFGLPGMLIGGLAGGVMNTGAGIYRNQQARKQMDLYDQEREKNKRDKIYAMNQGRQQIAHDRLLNYDRGFVYAEGGPLDAGNGVTQFPTGGSHESNPNGGIYQGMSGDGQPNLVEQGEVKWKDYIFPVRMKPTKAMLKEFKLDTKMAGKNYAEIATEIQKESESRPNDPLYIQTMDEMLGRLRLCHEEHQARQQAKEMMKMMEALPPEAQMQMIEQMSGGQPMGMPQPNGAPMQMPEQSPMPLEQTQPGMMEQPMAACGGRQKAHKFAEGGDISRFMKMMGFKTKSEYDKWAKENKATLPVDFDKNSVDWQSLSTIVPFLNYISKNNPSLAHAIQSGYLTGKRDEAKENSFHTEKGHWDNPTGASWEGSLDEAWLQALEDAKEDGIDLTRADTRTLEKYLGATEAYNKSTDWLKENTDNRLKYLNSVINSQYTSPAAKAFAKRFVDDKGKWKKGVANDYNTIFGITRGKDPGDYWKSVYGALREQEENNLLYNPETGEYETLYGDPSEYVKDGTYDWADGLKDITNNYYSPKPTVEESIPRTEPIENADNLPYPKYSLGPALGMSAVGMMGAFNLPDFEKANAMEAFQWQPRDYTPIGDYMSYKPMDENYMANILRGQAGATRRAIGNHAGPSTNPALLAADYNAMTALGDSIIRMEEANEKNRQGVAAFNRGTNQYNASEANTAEQANFGLQPYIYGQTKDVAEARDAATTLASKMNSDALSGVLGNLEEAYKTKYATDQLDWLMSKGLIPGIIK